MRIGVPIWGSRVSPVFDAAGRLLIVDVESGRVAKRLEEGIADFFPARKVRRLRELGVEVLICGGISAPLAAMIEAAGIRVTAWVSGDVEEVIRAYLSGMPPDPRFLMPGFRRWRRRFRGGWGPGGHWR